MRTNTELQSTIRASFVGLATVALIVSTAAITRPSSAHAAEDTAQLNCRAISTNAIRRLQSTLDNAYDDARTDASRNGSNGAYAVAATNSRDLIKRALDRSARMLADHRKFDERTTTAAEAGTAKEHARNIIEVLPQAAHWASISNIYHSSGAARSAFDGASSALQQGQSIFVNASNCYMDGWTP